MIEASDTGSAEAAEGRRRDFWPDDESGRKLPSPKLLMGAVAALVAVVVAVVAVVLLTGGGDEAKPQQRAVPTAYAPDYLGEGFAKLASRTKDARPITEGEAFSTKTLKSGKYTFTLAESKLSSDCKAATWGGRLQGDLAKYQCSQIARAAYVSADKKHVGQFAVINLVSEEGVKQILRDLEPATGAGWVSPLQPKGVPAFGPGFSAAYTKTYGHYAVVTWVERAGGAQPASLNEMIDVSLVVENAADFLYGRLDLVSGAKAGQ